MIQVAYAIIWWLARKYPAESLQKFSSDWERYKPIYEKDGVTIYQVLS